MLKLNEALGLGAGIAAFVGLYFVYWYSCYRGNRPWHAFFSCCGVDCCCSCCKSSRDKYDAVPDSIGPAAPRAERVV